MAELSVIWAVLAEQGAAANPYPLRSWGCADLLPAVDHQLSPVARSGWLSLTFGPYNTGISRIPREINYRQKDILFS